MGNKMCKKKTDTVDNPTATTKSNSAFDRIFSRLHLKPTTWKSDSHLNKKQVSRHEGINSKRKKNNMNTVDPNKRLSKSSDWTPLSLEVPDDDSTQLKSPKLVLIYNDKNAPPTPPPRKHRKKGLREKIETVTKNKLQALQNKKPQEEMRRPVEEPLAVKKVISYSCPICEHDCTIHNRDHKHEISQKTNIDKVSNKQEAKLNKRKKNLSVISLPNYSELKLAVAYFDDIDKAPDSTAIHNSTVCIPNGTHKKLSHASSTGRLESYMTRCRSFGSLLPHQLLDKIRTPNKKPLDIGSDDSFGRLEDWDLKILEHYRPRDASLPRPRKPQRSDKEVLSGLEGLIVKDEVERPVKPARRSESLIKKTAKKESESGKAKDANSSNVVEATIIMTPPTTPLIIKKDELPPPINYEKLPREDDRKIEHSSLMKILQQYSSKDKRRSRIMNGDVDEETGILEYIDASSTKSSKKSSLTSSVIEYENKPNYIQDFIDAEKLRTAADLVTKYSNSEKAKT